jgi:hypothetical protein
MDPPLHVSRVVKFSPPSYVSTFPSSRPNHFVHETTGLVRPLWERGHVIIS